jgi:hypothetical protein
MKTAVMWNVMLCVWYVETNVMKKCPASFSGAGRYRMKEESFS